MRSTLNKYIHKILEALLRDKETEKYLQLAKQIVNKFNKEFYSRLTIVHQPRYATEYIIYFEGTELVRVSQKDFSISIFKCFTETLTKFHFIRPWHWLINLTYEQVASTLDIVNTWDEFVTLLASFSDVEH